LLFIRLDITELHAKNIKKKSIPREMNIDFSTIFPLTNSVLLRTVDVNTYVSRISFSDESLTFSFTSVTHTRF